MSDRPSVPRFRPYNTRQAGINYYYSILLLHRAITEDVLLRTHTHYIFRHDRTAVS